MTIVELLLCHGAHVNAVDGNGDTALHVAVAYHSLLRAEGSAQTAEVCAVYRSLYPLLVLTKQVDSTFRAL